MQLKEAKFRPAAAMPEKGQGRQACPVCSLYGPPAQQVAYSTACPRLYPQTRNPPTSHQELVPWISRQIEFLELLQTRADGPRAYINVKSLAIRPVKLREKLLVWEEAAVALPHPNIIANTIGLSRYAGPDSIGRFHDCNHWGKCTVYGRSPSLPQQLICSCRASFHVASSLQLSRH